MMLNSPQAIEFALRHVPSGNTPICAALCQSFDKVMSSANEEQRLAINEHQDGTVFVDQDGMVYNKHGPIGQHTLDRGFCPLEDASVLPQNRFNIRHVSVTIGERDDDDVNVDVDGKSNEPATFADLKRILVGTKAVNHDQTIQDAKRALWDDALQCDVVIINRENQDLKCRLLISSSSSSSGAAATTSSSSYRTYYLFVNPLDSKPFCLSLDDLPLGSKVYLGSKAESHFLLIDVQHKSQRGRPSSTPKRLREGNMDAAAILASPEKMVRSDIANEPVERIVEYLSERWVLEHKQESAPGLCKSSIDKVMAKLMQSFEELACLHKKSRTMQW